MRLATYKKEESLPDLVGRLYSITGPGSQARARDAEVALLKANPHLRDLKKVPEGALIMVPEVAEVKITEEQQMLEEAADEITRAVRGTLAAVTPALEMSIKRQIDETNKSLKLLKSRDLRKLAEEEPALKEHISVIEKEGKAQLKEISALEKFHKQASRRLEEDLKEMNRGIPIPALKVKPSARPRKKRMVYHVTYQKESGDWRVLEEGVKQPESTHSTKSEAVESARKLAKSRIPSQLKVHKRDGKIQTEYTYGDDPRRTPG